MTNATGATFFGGTSLVQRFAQGMKLLPHHLNWATIGQKLGKNLNVPPPKTSPPMMFPRSDGSLFK
eukprot:TRINITY_DN3488_c0_g1_i1.p2 TRINITY_DN3488_c0_g1~~TRINITY_DN3488_c0_g1_i1.p2  ORF type:complete len:66 (+),score=7.73 TRINITY_DN3488_c0_g1_i1:21-218(+)